MEKVIIRNGDLDGSQLVNAASEVTLAAIRAAIEKMAKSAGPGTQRANDQVRDLGEASDDTSNSLEDLAEQALSVSSVLGRIGAPIGMAARSLTALGQSALRFADSFIDAQPKITDFTNALASSKLNILGLGSVINRVAEIILGNFENFRSLTKSGIILSEQVSDFTATAGKLRLTTAQVAQLLMDNSNSLSLLGGASAGARLAIKGASDAFNVNREILQNWGIDFEEQGEQYTNFLALNAMSLRRGTMTMNELNAASAPYSINLRRLASLTGKQVSEVENEMAAINLDKSFQSFVAGIEDPAQQAKFRNMISTYEGVFGDAGRDMAKSMILGVAPVTDASKNLAAVAPGLLEEVNKSYELAQTMTGDAAKYSTANLANLEQWAQDNNDFISNNSRIGATLGMLNNEFGTAISNTIEGLIRLQNGYENQTVDATLLQVAMQDFENAIGHMREKITGLFSDIIGSEAFGKSLANFSAWLDKISEMNVNPFDEEGRQNIVNEFISLFDKIWTDSGLKDTIVSFFDELMDKILVSMDESLWFFNTTDSVRDRVASRQIDSLTPAQESQVSASSQSFANTPDFSGMNQGQQQLTQSLRIIKSLESKLSFPILGTRSEFEEKLEEERAKVRDMGRDPSTGERVSTGSGANGSSAADQKRNDELSERINMNNDILTQILRQSKKQTDAAENN